MLTVRIEHQIHDFDAWKAAFDRDPAGRKQSGVLSYRILRPIEDPNYIMIDLDFAGSDQAETFVETMNKVWQSSQAAPALKGRPQARIVEVVESQAL
jgi:hypothetical protein